MRETELMAASLAEFDWIMKWIMKGEVVGARAEGVVMAALVIEKIRNKKDEMPGSTSQEILKAAEADFIAERNRIMH